jgi:hypothetical protein
MVDTGKGNRSGLGSVSQRRSIMVTAKGSKQIVFWELVFESIRHRPIRSGLSILLIAVPVALMLTVIALGQRLVSNSTRLASGSVVVRSPSGSVRNFGSGPVPQQGPFRQAVTNPLIAVTLINCFAVTLLSMHGAVLQRKREIGILRSLGASNVFVIGIVLTQAGLLGFGGAIFGLVLSQGLLESLMILGLPASRQSWEWWSFTAGIVSGAAILGGLYPCAIAVRQDVIDALTYD